MTSPNPFAAATSFADNGPREDSDATAPVTMPIPRFAIGDTVYHASVDTDNVPFPCPDCEGRGKWKAVSPKGLEAPIQCPRCDGRGSLRQFATKALVARRTVGQVRMEWPRSPHSDDDAISYMCSETGVGSGSIYYESKVFASKEDAEIAAKAMADKRNAELDSANPDRVRQRELFGYEITSALKAEADDARREAEIRYDNLLNRVLDLDTFPIGYRIDRDGCETADMLHGSLEQADVELVQNALLRGDEKALRQLADYRREAGR